MLHRTQYQSDKRFGICRVSGICFEEKASDVEIIKVLSEVSNSISAPCLMTRKALANFINAPSPIVRRMEQMPIRSRISFGGMTITRWSNSTYNALAV